MLIFRYFELISVAQLGEHLVGNVNLGRAEDDAAVAGTVEHELIAAQVGNVLDGIVDFFLNGLYERSALLVEFAFRAKVLALQVGSLFLLCHDGILLGLLLFCRQEHDLVLVVLVHGLRLGGQRVYFGLPLL